MKIHKELIMRWVKEIAEYSSSKGRRSILDKAMYYIKKHSCIPVSYHNKLWSVDFISYVCNNDVELDLKLFEEEDVKEILKFIRNKIYIALNSGCIEECYLIEKRDKEFRSLYSSHFKKKVRYGGHYTYINYKNRRYILKGNLSFYTYISVFYHELGIPFIPKEILRDLSHKDIVDGGAYIGDSLIVLDSLKPKRIFAFEPEESNYRNLQETIRLNTFFSKIIPLQIGLSDKETCAHVEGKGAKAQINDKNMSNGGVHITTVDKISKTYDAKIGLIKLDVEGYELETIKGAKNTIKKYKPVLLISVYHAGKDFFEIPSLLKRWVPEYKYRFLNLNRISPFSERVLLAY